MRDSTHLDNKEIRKTQGEFQKAFQDKAILFSFFSPVSDPIYVVLIYSGID